MRTLLLTDLEGVAGVDSLADLLEGSPGFPRAQQLLGDEIAAAVGGLRAGATGAGEIVVSDSHRGGPSPTVLAAALPPGVSLHRSDDAYDARLFAGVGAVACLGMHAAERGFVPHTFDVTCMWELDGRPVSESDLVLGLAAELGVPGVFVAGEESVTAPGIPLLPTKAARSAIAARSRDPAAICAGLAEIAREPPRALPRLEGALAIRFRSAWMADLVERSGGQRQDETAIVIPGRTLAERLVAGQKLLAPVGGKLIGACREGALAEDVATLVARPFERALPPSRQAEAARALAAFLELTDRRDDDYAKALRGLTLHMLAGHAPAFFARADLDQVLADAVDRLTGFAPDFPLTLAPEDGMARLDAHYVLGERGRTVRLDAASLDAYVGSLFPRQLIFAWLLGELAEQLGVPARRVRPGVRPYRTLERRYDLYWLTHLVLLETHYLQRPPPRAGWEQVTEEILLAVDFTLERDLLDIAGELAICMVVLGEARAPERARVLARLAAAQAPDGSVLEGATVEGGDGVAEYRNRAHATAVALLAFATAV